MVDPQFIRDLVANPRESLTVELKAWFDPGSPEGQSKIVRCALAMRNHGGGFMLVGFEDGTARPLTDEAPPDVRLGFNADDVQKLVTRFASDPFEVEVHFAMRDGVEFPVPAFPGGVRTPVATKSLLGPQTSPLVRENKVYVRTLNASNVPSSAEAGWKDWSRLMETCFENREADIGRFIRRHLGGASGEGLRQIAAALSLAPQQPETVEQRLQKTLDAGLARCQAAAAARPALPPHGTWEVGVLIESEAPPPSQLRSKEFLGQLLASHPDYSGWPVFVDSRNFADRASRPYVNGGAWEAFTVALDAGLNHIDFWRLSATEGFYLYQAFKDDLRPDVRPPLTVLDFTLPILRVADALAVSMTFAKALGYPADATTLAIGFRWRGLKGRTLDNWGSQDRDLRPGPPAHQDEVMSCVRMPLDTPLDALPVYVQEASAPLFDAFDGKTFGPALYEQLTRKLLERRY